MVNVIGRLNTAVALRLDEIDKSSPTNQFKPEPLPPSLTVKWWSDNKAKAVKDHLLGDPSTALGKRSMQSSPVRLSTIKTIRWEAPAHVVQSLNKLAVVLNEYQPSTKSKNPFKHGKPHPGGAELRQLLLKTLDEEYTKVESAHLSGMDAQTITFSAPVSEKAWSKAKAEFVDYGMVKKDTGIGAAIKNYLAAKDKSVKAPNDAKLTKAFQRQQSG